MNRAHPILVLSLFATVAAAQPPSYGIDFVTVASPGNSGYDGPDPDGRTLGRGRVDYEYRIGRTEITTAQWLEFFNTFAGTATPPPYFDILGPNNWGARRNLNYSGPGVQYELQNGPEAPMRPVGGIDWVTAGLYCNWLHNGKQADPASLTQGAYDTSLWDDPWTPGGPNVPWTHEPGAQFWIPTLDESLKAQHYDPARYGPGQGGWWVYKNGSDQPGTPGPPGVGTTSAGYMLPGQAQWNIPLGAYPNSLSAWGLLDTSGGAQEWTEETSNLNGGRRHLLVTGSHAGQGFLSLWDAAYGNADDSPAAGTSTVGLRIASSVPSPSVVVVALLSAVGGTIRRRRPCE